MPFFKKIVPIALVLLNALIIGYFSLKITGRQLPTDFVRPFLVSTLSWWAIYILLKAQCKKTAIAWTVVLAIFQSVTAISYSYYQSIDSFFTGDDVVAIAQSNVEEIYDFAEHYILNTDTLTYGTLIVVLSLITLGCLAKFAKGKVLHFKKTALLFSLLFVVASSVIVTQLRPVKYYRIMVSDLENKIASFHEITAKLESGSVSNAKKEGTGELYVLVIGESLSRDNMGVYNHSIDNTPFLSDLATKDNTILFNNAYSSFVNTVPSVTASFSQGNIHTGLTFPQGENLISMAKKSGIKTHWISNQVKNGNADTPIGAISSLADISFFTTNYVFDGSYSQKPDMVLIPHLEKLSQELDSSKNNFVIVHIMGNHSPYYNRVPSDYPQIKINKSSQIGRLVLDAELFSTTFNEATNYDHYLTAVKYNDEFMAKLYDIFANRPDFQAFVYYSDHAEAVHYVGVLDEKAKSAPVGRHNVAQFSYAMSRIPFIVNVSDSFKSKYSSTFNALNDNKNEIVTNDTLYDFMLDLMQVKSEAINYKLSAANPEFDMGNVDGIKLLSDKQVSLDPEYIANVTALDPIVDRVFIRSSNALFKANSLLAKGYKGLHINTIVKGNKLYVKALSKFNDDFISVDEYLKELSNQDASVLVSLDRDVNVDLLKPHLSDKRVVFFVQDKEQYVVLKSSGCENLVLQADANVLEGLDIKTYTKICVDYNLFKANLDKLQPWLDRAKEHNIDALYIISNELSVQEKNAVDTLKAVPDFIKLIVNYDNAFNSDF